MTTDQPTALLVHGLDKIDRRTFEKQLAGDVRFEKEALTSDKAGEPATIVAIVALTALGIRALAGWLMKERNRGRTEVVIETEYPNGRRTKTTVKVDTFSSKAPPAEVIAQLGETLQLDPEVIAQLVTAG
jgi:hypothetical protein